MSYREAILLKSRLSPGDITVMTAAVRDLVRHYPDDYSIFVQTTAPEIWDGNPFVRIDTGAHIDREIECHYPLVHSSNQLPVHFIQAHGEYLSEQLGRPIPITRFAGDIYLSEQEQMFPPKVPRDGESLGDKPYWLIVAGGKSDFTIKWWIREHWQAVVDSLVERVRFVQVGSREHSHWPLANVLDLLGGTSIRELIQLVYHCEGVICPNTFLMHLAAAVPTRDGRLRPCVVISGGREPVSWFAYPGHQVHHTVGALYCCSSGGCWRARTRRLNDGSDLDRSICVNKVSGEARCMKMISPEAVVATIEYYLGDLQRRPPWTALS